MAVAACRVEKQERCVVDGVQEVRTVALHHLGFQAQQRQVVACQFAEVRLLLHVDGPLEAARQKREIHAQAAGEVNEGGWMMGDWCLVKGQRLDQPSFITGSQFAGTLLHREVRRIVNVVDGSPRRQFSPRRLPAGNLVEGENQVHFLLLCLQRQLPDVVVAMLTNEILCGLVHRFTYFLPRFT